MNGMIEIATIDCENRIGASALANSQVVSIYGHPLLDDHSADNQLGI